MHDAGRVLGQRELRHVDAADRAADASAAKEKPQAPPAPARGPRVRVRHPRHPRTPHDDARAKWIERERERERKFEKKRGSLRLGSIYACFFLCARSPKDRTASELHELTCEPASNNRPRFKEFRTEFLRVDETSAEAFFHDGELKRIQHVSSRFPKHLSTVPLGLLKKNVP